MPPGNLWHNESSISFDIRLNDRSSAMAARTAIAVAVGMISPGPVVITATFVGYLVAGFWGSLVSTDRNLLSFVHPHSGRGAVAVTARIPGGA